MKARRLACVLENGHTGTGIANSMGASSLGILLCLGLPWAISIGGVYGQGKGAFLTLHNNGTEFVIMSLVLVSIVQFSILSLSRFRLLKLTGVALALAYLTFVVYAVMVELDFLFPAFEGNYC